MNDHEQNEIDSFYDLFVLISVAWPGLRTLILLMKTDNTSAKQT